MAGVPPHSLKEAKMSHKAQRFAARSRLLIPAVIVPTVVILASLVAIGFGWIAGGGDAPVASAQGTGFMEDISKSAALEPALSFASPPAINVPTTITLSVHNILAAGVSTAAIHLPDYYTVEGLSPTGGTQDSAGTGYNKITWQYQPAVGITDTFAVQVRPATPSDEHDSILAFVREATPGGHDPESTVLWAQVGVPGEVPASVTDEMPEAITVNDDPRFGEAPTEFTASDVPLAVSWVMGSIDPVSDTVRAVITTTNTITNPVTAGLSLAAPDGWSIVDGSTPTVFSLAPTQARQFTFLLQPDATPGTWSASLLILLDSVTTDAGYAPYYIVQEGSTAAGGDIPYRAQTRYLQPTVAEQAEHGLLEPGGGGGTLGSVAHTSAHEVRANPGALQQVGDRCAPTVPPTCCEPLVLVYFPGSWFSAYMSPNGALVQYSQVTISGHVTLEGYHNPWGDWQGETTYEGTELRIRVLPRPGHSSYLQELKRGVTDLGGNYKFCVPIGSRPPGPSYNFPVVIELSSADTAERGENPAQWSDYSARAYRYIESEGGETEIIWQENMEAEIPVPFYNGPICPPTGVPMGVGTELLASRSDDSLLAPADNNPCDCVPVPNYEMPTLTVGRDNASGFFIASYIADNVRAFMLNEEHYGECIHTWQGNQRGFPVTTFNPTGEWTGSGNLQNGQGKIWLGDGAQWDMWTISHEWAHVAHDVVSPNGVGDSRLREGFATAFATLQEEQDGHEGWRGKPRRSQTVHFTATHLEGYTGTGGTLEHGYQNYGDMGAYFWDLEDNTQDVLPNCNTGLAEPLDTPTFADVFNVLDAGPQTIFAYYDQWIIDYGDTPEFGAVSYNHVITVDTEPICTQ
jgi:hypothetical protein